MARVIRRTRSSVVSEEAFEARSEARAIVARAEERAKSIEVEAQERVAATIATANEQGLEQGNAQIATLWAEAAALRDRALREAEGEAVELALAAAKRIVGEELALSPARIAAIVGDVIERARRATKVVVHVHPDDAPALRQDPTVAGGRAIFTVEEDPGISRGGCVVQTELGQLDARVETRVEQLAAALATAREAG